MQRAAANNVGLFCSRSKSNTRACEEHINDQLTAFRWTLIMTSYMYCMSAPLCRVFASRARVSKASSSCTLNRRVTSSGRRRRHNMATDSCTSWTGAPVRTEQITLTETNIKRHL